MGNLIRHVKTIHDKINDAACGLCDYKTSQRSSLVAHRKMVHAKIKDIFCDKCDFATEIDLPVGDEELVVQVPFDSPTVAPEFWHERQKAPKIGTLGDRACCDR